MISRREFLEMTAGAGSALALTPELLRAFEQQPGKVMQRAIPSSGEMLPVISFSPRAEADNAAMKEILRTFLDNGGRVVDVMHGGPAGEQAGRDAANELGIQDKLFWTSSMSLVSILRGVLQTPDAATVRAHMEAKLATLKLSRIDLAMVSSYSAHVPTNLAVLREMKKEGRVRYIGVWELLSTDASNPSLARLESVMRNEPIDFVATDYHVGDRRVEEKLLPLALERKIAFMAYFTFDRGGLFKRVGTTPVPAWAAEFGARTWAQFFIKYVLSHPAVTVVRTGTTKPAHMLENIGAGIGRLPDQATRKRMAEFVDSARSASGERPHAGAGVGLRAVSGTR
jgi:aryl-alcohol dehydrogenase-like predicted oxidoreductase